MAQLGVCKGGKYGVNKVRSGRETNEGFSSNTCGIRSCICTTLPAMRVRAECQLLG